jgi:hypothetical protein
MSTFLFFVGVLAVGFVLGLVAEWPALRDWRNLARAQSVVLHTDDKTPRHPFTAAGPDDFEARNQVGGRP